MRVFLAVMAICLWSAPWAVAGCKPDIVTIRGGFGQVNIQVELATTNETRSQGLMFRESMPRLAGMLFVYDRPQRAAFWMKNTLLSLDMLFTDSSGVITHIHKNAVPQSLDSIDGGRGVLAVLEVNAGLADRLGVKVGDQMRHPAFAENPVWPCE